MIILVKDTSGTYRSQIRSSHAAGFKQLHVGSCTQGALLAARNLVTKHFGPSAAATVLRAAEEEAPRLIPRYAQDPEKWKCFSVFTFNPEVGRE